MNKRDKALVERLTDEWAKFIDDPDGDLQGVVDAISALRNACLTKLDRRQAMDAAWREVFIK